jgi:type I restriction enzyme S subunit
MSDVPEGYKMSEVGVIPEEWEVKTLGEILQSSRLGGNYQNSGNENNHPLMKMGNINRGFIDISKVEYITDKSSPSEKDKLQYGDILFNTRNTLELVGKVAIWRNELPLAYYNSNLLRLEFNPSDVSSNFFINNILNTKQILSQLRRFATGTTSVAAIYTRDLIKLQIPLPPLPEQQAIASALSDVDALITALEQLITKKRNIKQGAMQQLLTGKKRLPGFSGAWEVVNIAENSILKARIGWQGLTTAEYLKNGEYYLITGTDFIEGKINWSGCHFIDENRYIQDKNIQLRNDDVLITKDGTIGKVGYVDNLPGKATLNSGVFVIRPRNKSYFPLFFYYVLKSNIFDTFMKQLRAGSTISHLYQKDFVDFSFSVPSLSEQQAIAKILSDMDTEIEALEQKRDKYNAIKQGMMQELLTGERRLA